MVAIMRGPINWSMKKTEDGLRDYFVEWFIETTSTHDGPAIVEACPGLPLPGSTWNVQFDVNEDVFCTRELEIAPAPGKDQGPSNLWVAKQTFSNRRTEGEKLPNPLLEPARWSGSFVNRTKPASDLLTISVHIAQDGTETPVERILEFDEPEDLLGIHIYPGPVNTAWEPFKGKETEFDTGGPTVEVELNILELPLSMYATMYKTVNGNVMWGLPPRTIKLQNVSWQRKTWNSDFTFYYIVKYEFEVDYKTWDKVVFNKGKRCLKGHGESRSAPMDPLGEDPATGLPNYRNPKNYEIYKDPNGENSDETALDPYGIPIKQADWDAGFQPVYQKFIYYRESNFLNLGIPPVIPTGTF